MIMFCFASIFIVLITFVSSSDRLLVNTPLGPVLGTAATTLAGVDYYRFDGIPYAKPPIGNLRFKPPEPVDPWTDTFVADKEVMCLQNSFATNPIVEGVEDCLHVYVSTPKQLKKTREPLPVIAYVHGGAFILGSGNRNFWGHHDFFINKNVVVVTFNYRVGPFGFLSTENEEAHGNYGLLDQVAALKWIQQNIASFGGNPNEVTLSGDSAGGASVFYHILSPLSRGLFHRAIPMSGTAINPWPRTKIAAKRARDLAEKLGCPTDSSTSILKCLRNKRGEEILSVSRPSGKQKWGASPFVWVPRVDSESKNPLLPREPIDMMASGDFNWIPLMMGFTRDEGLWLYPTFPVVSEDDIQLLATDWQRVCEIGVLNSEEFEVLKSEAKPLCNKIRKFYISPKNINNVYHQEYIDLLGMAFFTAGVYKSAELMHQFTPVYLYAFDFFSKKTNFMTIKNHPDVPLLGVQHADDVMYLFNQSSPQLLESPEKEVVDMMTTLWTNFARNGIPTFNDRELQWPKFEGPEYQYASLNYPPSILQNYKPTEIRFWDSIFSSSWHKQEQRVKEEL